MMTMNDNKDVNVPDLVKHLVELASGNRKPLYNKQGICLEIGINTYDHCLWLKQYIETWVHYVGEEPVFPIPSTDKKWSARDYYLKSDRNLWHGKQGAYRKSLCLHIAERLKEEYNL